MQWWWYDWFPIHVHNIQNQGNFYVTKGGIKVQDLLFLLDQCWFYVQFQCGLTPLVWMWQEHRLLFAPTFKSLSLKLDSSAHHRWQWKMTYDCIDFGKVKCVKKQVRNFRFGPHFITVLFHPDSRVIIILFKVRAENQACRYILLHII